MESVLTIYFSLGYHNCYCRGVLINFMKNKSVILSQDNLEEIYSAFNQGKIICIPTDTIYALSCDATNIEAIQKIYTLKHRPLDKTLPMFMSNTKMASLYANFYKKELSLANKFWPGALTLVSRIKNTHKNLPNLLKNNQKIAIRVPKNKLIQSICQSINKPIIATSANISNQKNINSLDEIIKEFQNKVNFIIKDNKELSDNCLTASTIIEFTNNEKYKILRKGRIPKIQLERILS
ncbi:threonylcarbamoyl-AMP synthase [Candidatus Aquarickettsia rohweri]|uniref:L-threonylcarbamoyladenylate synthase n=2 Tax=Candidatus Aquarickettsia rohweri TaxID=2602574 RepID=A0A429XED7_9RICK|nr:threonylcarbamoyl-AMP synthase [Candidatus Aquarickettsia rohweri]